MKTRIEVSRWLRAVLASLAATACTLAVAQVVVTPSTPGWGFFEETATGSGMFIG